MLTLEGGFGFANAYDLNCIRGFLQLQVFQMHLLAVQNWKLTNGAMPCLQNLVIDGCYDLGSLQNELWSLSTLKKVLVTKPS